MKATGIVRQIDNLGRFVIPKEIRETMNIESNDSLEIFTEDDRIILKKYAPACIFCGEVEGVIQFQKKLICSHCINAIAAHADSIQE
ncbi:MAG: AbrB/MazE/SpoVT family DNA-binding domain-containing protein [Clostridia bacterium]|nr:AbrB/MazE/SpoVT family DNA-binding domain-containing protein [Clostridia bacterium]